MNDLKYIYLTILFITSMIGLLDFRKLPISLKFLSILILVSLIIELIGFYTLIKSDGKQVNINIYKLYSFVECILIGIYFYLIVLSKIIKNGIIITVIIVVIAQSLIVYFNLLPFHKAYLISIFFKSIFSIAYLRQLLNSNANNIQNPHFWIVTGVLFFNVGFFFLSGFINYISSKNLELAQKLYSINHLLNIIYYSLVTYGFICQRRLAKSSL